MLNAVEKRCEKQNPGPIFPHILNENTLVEALENTYTLEGHTGCVNSLRWNKSGTLLASGSDDRTVKIWRAGVEKETIPTGHEGNVFAVEFLPSSNDKQMITGAADCLIFQYEIEKKRPICKWETEGRIKRICTVQHDPHLFWAASESDMKLFQVDTRTEECEALVEPSKPTNPNNEEVKSVAISEVSPYLMAVGYDETPVRLFDRRNFTQPLLTFSPLDSTRNSFNATHVAFNQLGTEVVVNYGRGGGVYVFSTDGTKEPNYIQRLLDVFELEREPVISSHSLPHPELRETGSNAIREKHFGQAIDFYSDLIVRKDPNRAFRSVCYSNRATASLLRRSRGDTYACVRDCVKALEIHRGNSKAVFRLIRSFKHLEQVRLAQKSIEIFKLWFPGDKSIAKVEAEIALMPEPAEDHPGMSMAPGCVDYQERYMGSSNNQTDIKEANFFGSRDQYIVCGSDCGHMYIWSRDTTKLMGIWTADSHILNIVQPHPHQFMIATSGIDDELRLWEPIIEPPEHFESRKISDPYEFMENKREMVGGFNRNINLNLLREFVRESPQCAQS